jgi:hypothetical protein
MNEDRDIDDLLRECEELFEARIIGGGYRGTDNWFGWWRKKKGVDEWNRRNEGVGGVIEDGVFCLLGDGVESGQIPRIVNRACKYSDTFSCDNSQFCENRGSSKVIKWVECRRFIEYTVRGEHREGELKEGVKRCGRIRGDWKVEWKKRGRNGDV